MIQGMYFTDWWLGNRYSDIFPTVDFRAEEFPSLDLPRGIQILFAFVAKLNSTPPLLLHLFFFSVVKYTH